MLLRDAMIQGYTASVSPCPLTLLFTNLFCTTPTLVFAQECRLGVWFGFVGAALLPAVGTCVVLVFGAMPGR